MVDRHLTEKERILVAYQSLAPFAQSVLQLVSVIHEPVNTASMVNCLRRAGSKGPDGLGVTIASLAPHIDELRAAGLLDEQNRCHAAILEPASRQAVAAGTYAGLARVVQEELPVSFYYSKRSQTCRRAMREFRIAVYTQEQTDIDNLHALLNSQCREFIETAYPVVRICTSPFQPDWFGGLSSSIKFYALEQIFACSLHYLEYFEQPLAYLEKKEGQGGISRDAMLPFHRLLADYLVWRGSLDKVEALLAGHGDSFVASGFGGCLSFLRGDNDRALELFSVDLAELRRITGNSKACFYGVPGLLFILALLKTGDQSQPAAVSGYIAEARLQKQSSMLSAVYNCLAAVIPALQNQVAEADKLIEDLDPGDHSVVMVFAALTRYWVTGELSRENIDELAAVCSRARSNGFDWLALEGAELLGRVGNAGQYSDEAAEIRKRSGLQSIISAISLGEPWERRLKALIRSTAADSRGAACDNGKRTRLVWLASYKGSRLAVSAREQHVLNSGEWSKGRPVALSRLHSGRNLAAMTDQDRRICRAIRREQSTREVFYRFDMDQALLAMIGHPLIFLEESPVVPVEFVKGEPELIVEQAGDNYRIKLAREISEEDVAVLRETMTRFRIIQVTDRHIKIARIIGSAGLTVPKSALEQVMVAIGNISSFMTVHSVINGRAADIDEVAADAGIYIQLLPVGAGFRMKIYVKPFAVGGPYLKPGRGKENLIAEVKGRRLQTRRDLGLETAKAREVEAACPTLALLDESEWGEWEIQRPADCLQILLELQQVRDRVTVEWPEGGRISVSHQAPFDQLSLKIRRKRDWFELSGRLELDENLVLDMKELLKAARETPGRFIPLGDGRFMALTEEFRKRLDELDAFAESRADSGKGAALCIHPLSVSALEEFVDSLSGLTRLDVDEDWQRQIRLIREAQVLVPVVPSTLRAELRDYQVEGYRWLARLAHWGMGACLADDMGLGKTLQALAILLLRAEQGPALVVAPTSVCMNWQAEAGRFAPTLNIIMLGSNSRQDLVGNLKGFDVLLTSYNLLQQEAELLASVEWQTIVLDEAQAIKNMVTKRSRAAMSLNGRFKLITTGTPIENHLGELWNLFNFISPGLLGSLERFNSRYAIPIEKYQDREARKKLKKLIRPFILRRIKSQVLEELPSRTEIVLQLEMSDEEAAFYEALRQQALDHLQSLGASPTRNMQILAEIMRLRRACCNPRLVMPASLIASSKLELFGKVVDELLENRHKALVFSQFVGHLQIIREFLDARGISYCYLDGATPVRERKKQVSSFQAGQGDLFLISLKAGGLGLNLTAADYVIHMDPWWNPAVEDQASDRAHRIGQKRPVTIYRLVCRNTIEEKIVKLHQEKRDLANSLLEGSDVSATISAEDLLNLITEN